MVRLSDPTFVLEILVPHGLLLVDIAARHWGVSLQPSQLRFSLVIRVRHHHCECISLRHAIHVVPSPGPYCVGEGGMAPHAQVASVLDAGVQIDAAAEVGPP